MRQFAKDTRPNARTWPTLSLRRLLLAVAFVAGFFGFSRLASTNGIGLASIPAVACIALAFGVATRRYVLALVISFTLAFASYTTTSVVWDGGFPFAEVRIIVVDESGDPVPNVAMSVTRRKGGQPALGYPISEFGGSPVVGNSDGEITCHQTDSGLQFGGHAWRLFWCIPVGFQSPKFDVHFDHPKFLRTSISVWRLFETNYKFYEDFPKSTIDVGGHMREIPIYRQRIVLSSH